MFYRLIDDFKMFASLAARRTFFIAAVAISLFVTTAFLCAAAFVFVLERYGLVQACLTGAAIFFVVTLISAGSYFVLKSSLKKKIVADVKSAAPSFTPDPMMLMAGLQVARAIGFKRILPVLAIAGLALGVLVARNQSSSAEDGDD